MLNTGFHSLKEIKDITDEEGVYGLFDYDLFLYDIGFGSQVDGNIVPFEEVARRIDERINNISETLHLVGYEGYFTGEGNFRYEIATIKKYKDTAGRKKSKPFHFKNIENYIKFRHNGHVVNGFETDDMLAVRQRQLGLTSIIISRDKDLRMVDGYHYGWECGKQGEFGPMCVSGVGEIDRKGKGHGKKFFWAQMLMGDTTDNIPGCHNRGKVYAFNLLNDLTTHEDMAIAVAEEYKKFYKESWKSAMLENGRLLWMHDQLDEHGNVILWELPNILEDNNGTYQ